MKGVNTLKRQKYFYHFLGLAFLSLHKKRWKDDNKHLCYSKNGDVLPSWCQEWHKRNK